MAVRVVHSPETYCHSNQQQFDSEQRIMQQEVSSSGCNTDRLLPRGLERKRISERGDGRRDRKRLREGIEEMEKLRTLVPNLRESCTSLSQVDIIEETISYIDSLHRRVAERMVSSVSTYPILTLDHVEKAERLSQGITGSEEQFRERLAALSQPVGPRESDGVNNNEDGDNANQNSEVHCKEPSDQSDDDPDKISEEQKKAIEVVKSAFVALITSPVSD